jgi:exopolysaccharide biosynthesis polyprenyl glycosylphosphotransferase
MNNFRKLILLIGDANLIYIALFLALTIRHGDLSFWPESKITAFFFQFSFISLFWILILYILDFYEIPLFKRVFDFFRNLLVFIFLASILGATYFYLKPETGITPKTILFLDVLIFSVFLCFWRYIFYRILKIKNFREKIIVVGFRPGLEELTDKHSLSRAGYEIVAFFSPDASFSEKLLAFVGMAKYGVISDINKLKEVTEKEKVSSVVFPRFLEGNEKIIHQVFSNLPLKLNYVSFADFYENLTKKVPIGAVNEVWFLENVSRSEKKVDDVLKRGFDIAFSLFCLLASILLFPFIALAIKLDSPGSLFYLQKRVGKDGKEFTLYKFRSMKESPDQYKEPWRERNRNQVTRVGRFLRRTHLDEIPQFWSILKGDISFVGPRPEWEKLAREFEKGIPFYPLRYLIKPGFTGWAQLHYIASTSLEEAKEKFKYDLYYIKNRNFFMDLGIILKTIRIIFRQ